jgi:hypothetical protein
MNARRGSIITSALCLFVLLAGIYSLSYSGAFKSGDEQLFVSGAVSLGGWGELSSGPVYAARAGLSYVEPLNAWLGAALYRLAEWLRVGVVHTLFLTNIYVIALTALVVFGIVCRQGYSATIAALVALLFGLGTLAWPHSKLYFRDPLAMLFVALAWWSFERIFVLRKWRWLSCLLPSCVVFSISRSAAPRCWAWAGCFWASARWRCFPSRDC